jgi:hypothetical protein
MFVIDVLISAATALTKVGTRRTGAVRRRFADIDKLGLGELLFFAYDLGGNEFVLNREWNKDCFAVFACYAFATEGNVLDS